MSIVLKQTLNQDDYKKINQLKDACLKVSKLHLKLELDFKLHLAASNKENAGLSTHETNEFLYYSNGQLIGYLSLFNLGGKTGELAGMVHPLYRRRGIFTNLYQLARDECNKRSLSKVLLVCDNHSSSGQAFLQSIHAELSFSEYLMVRTVAIDTGYNRNDTDTIDINRSDSITLRKATDSDVVTIAEMNRECFGVTGMIGMMPEEEAKIHRITYLIEQGSRPIGKIRTELYRNESIISGFCILPSYRGYGYGRQALLKAIRELSKQGIHEASLYVETHNRNAVQVYLGSGFEVQATINYYKAH